MKAMGSQHPDAYFLALGRFVDRFAAAEDMVYVALQTAGSIQAPTAQALFSGTRVREACSFIRRIHDANKVTIDARLSDALSHLVAVNTVRDNILHWGTRPDGNGLKTTNAFRAHTEQATREYAVSAELLENMTLDLGKVISTLIFYITTTGAPDCHRDPTNPITAQLLSAMREPWHFRPDQDWNSGPALPTAARSQKRQKKSSDA